MSISKDQQGLRKCSQPPGKGVVGNAGHPVSEAHRPCPAMALPITCRAAAELSDIYVPGISSRSRQADCWVRSLAR